MVIGYIVDIGCRVVRNYLYITYQGGVPQHQSIIFTDPDWPYFILRVITLFTEKSPGIQV